MIGCRVTIEAVN